LDEGVTRLQIASKLDRPTPCLFIENHHELNSHQTEGRLLRDASEVRLFAPMDLIAFIAGRALYSAHSKIKMLPEMMTGNICAKHRPMLPCSPFFPGTVGGIVAKARLDSWKSIADYLERSARTVQRWHAFHGLPVHHFGGCKGSVFAYSEEIDRWLLNQAEETSNEASKVDELDLRNRKSLALTARALEMWETHSEDSLKVIAGLFREAIDQDPGNSRAFIGLADSMIVAGLQGVMDSSMAYSCALEALRRAAPTEEAEVDATCSAAWVNLVYERKWRQARAKFEDVMEKRPERAFALSGMALVQVAEGDLAAASTWAWDAWRNHMLIGSLGALVCWIQYLAGEWNLALELAGQVRSSGGCCGTLAVVEALALLQAAPTIANLLRIESIAGQFAQNPILQGVLGYAYGVSDRTEKAWAIFHALEHVSPQMKRNNAYGMALISLGLDKRQEAIRWLEASYNEGSLWSLGFRSDPVLADLRGDPRLESLVRKIGTLGGSSSPSAPSFEYLARAI